MPVRRESDLGGYGKAWPNMTITARSVVKGAILVSFTDASGVHGPPRHRIEQDCCSETNDFGACLRARGLDVVF